MAPLSSQLQLGVGRHHCESSSSSKPIYDNNMEYVEQPNNYSSIEHMHDEKLSRQPHTNHHHVTDTLLMITASNNHILVTMNLMMKIWFLPPYQDLLLIIPQSKQYIHIVTIAEHTRTTVWHYFRPLVCQLYPWQY